jgi:hypothetical protein
MFNNHKIAIVIPYYNASNQILRVIAKIPNYIHTVIIVDDKSKELLPKKKINETINKSTNCVFLENEINLGVGGATKHGFSYAIKNNIDIIIKVDADDQMDLKYLPELIQPLVDNKSTVSKGNRFRDTNALKSMPKGRKIGNLALSFLTKIATGYWHNFDPTNGFLAIKTGVLKKINFSNLSNRYYFETSLLSEFYFQNAIISDIAMPAIYGDEKSNMNTSKMLIVFSKNLTITFFKRIIKKYFLYDFNIGSVYIFFGFPLLLFGIIYGVFNWVYYGKQDILTPTGTIMITTLSIIIGFQLILQAIQFDILNAPKE